MVRCVCCGRMVSVRATEPMSDGAMLYALGALIRRGVDVDALLADALSVNSLQFTSPGFVAWLRRHGFGPREERGLG